MATWGPTLIPRKTLNGRRRTQTVDEFGIASEDTEVTFTVENAGVQPTTGDQQSTLPEGYRDSKSYAVYTTTPVYTAEEATSNLADQIEVRDGIWCDVVKVDVWDYGLQSHYLAYVSERNER